ncbi:MAG: hypothetical protein GXP33_16155 [Spirochaetes bacterium]|nr:hypothetical protein [Spirochaetota bacterium]
MKIKNAVLIFLFLLVSVFYLESQSSSFSASLGMDFFNYKESYLDTGVAYNHLITNGLELALGLNFALRTENAGTDASPNIVPYFFIPLDIGLNFTFEGFQPATILFGVGVTPVLRIPPDETDTGRFYMGPYVKAGVRVKVQRLLNWFVEVQQDLVIGKPNWINTTTRIYTGINFSFSDK